MQKYILIEITFFSKKKSFKIFKNLTKYGQKIILLAHQNNHREISSMLNNAANDFDILITSLSVLHIT